MIWNDAADGAYLSFHKTLDAVSESALINGNFKAGS